MDDLIGIGLYTPAEAERLTGVAASKIGRWLRGHSANGRHYNPLWHSQVILDDGRTYLGFQDLMEVRVADAFIAKGVSAQRIRAAIELARDVYGHDRPLSTDRFRTDGKDIFLRVLRNESGAEEREHLLETFSRQYAFAEIINPSLKGVEFDEGGKPSAWWPRGRKGQIVIDPDRSFGQPIDSVSSVPTAVLAGAGRSEGVARAARAFAVSTSSIRRAIDFENELELGSVA